MIHYLAVVPKADGCLYQSGGRTDMCSHSTFWSLQAPDETFGHIHSKSVHIMIFPNYVLRIVMAAKARAIFCLSFNMWLN